MKLREMLKKQPMVVVQGGITGTLWLENEGAMKVKVFGRFDKNKFVHTISTFGDKEFAIKIDDKNTVDFFAEKEYEVAWAISENGVVLPDEYVNGNFIEKIQIEYPSTALAGVIDDKMIELNEETACLTKLIDHNVVEMGWKKTTTKWLNVEIFKKKGDILCGGDRVSGIVDKINLGMSLSFWRPVVEKSVFAIWKEGESVFCKEIESGREPIYKYTEKFSGGFSAVIMNKGGAPAGLLNGILGKELGPLKLWRSFILSYSDRTGFLEDRFKNLLVALDLVYTLCFEGEKSRAEREAQYDEMVKLLKRCIKDGGDNISNTKLKTIIRTKSDFVNDRVDFSTKIRRLCEKAGYKDGAIDGQLTFEECVTISHKVRNNLSHRGAFGAMKKEIGGNFGRYYIWLAMTTQIMIWRWSTEWSN
ncbi:hypothetical protein IJQ51_03070 [Candidatus Saccharibacteria bacterium]|nr:hypothetical protein [Candidatus Saccharibacteria bacterium]MBR0242902.1 hypothetical protein [Candidatus Saccharibacteria bacterium]MBR0431236.1 hypothetical protein [Candidatus Saccharibacteria bacterium]